MLEIGESPVVPVSDPFILPTSGVVEGAFSRDSAFKLAKTELNFLAALAAPEIFLSHYPQIHVAVWQLLVAAVNGDKEKVQSLTGREGILDEFLKLALGLPRGHAKTTLIKLFVLYCVLFTDRQFILIVCANSGLAENFLADVADMLDSANIKSVFGDWRFAMEKDTQDVKKFTFLSRDIIIQAAGKGAVRGLNIKNRRPDVIVMDDMQTREDSESPTQADKDLSWMLGTLMKLKDPRRCLYIFVGNMYHSPGCILRKLKNNKQWISFIVGAILSDGKPIWPELHSIESLMAELENDTAMGKPEIFFSEVQNDTETGVSAIFDITKVPASPYEEQREFCLGRFVIIDVATDKIGADDTTIALYGLYGTDIVMEDLEAGSMNPKQTIINSLKMALLNGATLICVESVAYQSTLLFWFNEVCEEIELTGIVFGEVFPRGLPKNHRIVQWFKRLLPQVDKDTGKVNPPNEYLSEKVRARVMFEAQNFRPMKKDNQDNIIDNGAYAQQAVELYGTQIAIPAMADHGTAAKVVEQNSPF